ncbi:MAG: DUF5691 domain-containing protein [Bacteroidota bacterium]
MNSSPPSSGQPWPALLRQLLLGTDQQPTPPEESLAGEEDAVEGLLTAVASAHLLRKGARPLEQWQGDLAKLPEVEEGASCSWRSVQHLKTILSGDRLQALPEFARLLERYEKRLPPESLPELLDQCLEEPALWPLVRPILGARGRWLLEQSQHWSRLEISLAAAQQWPDAKGKEQLELLQRYRQLDPAAARADLLLHWPNLPHQTQARLLPALAAQLSLADESFLEEARLAKRKPIRLAACDLLAKLPESALVQRLWHHAQEVVAYKRKKIVVQIPETLPKETVADGIVPTGSKTQLGLRGSWLSQVLNKIPLFFWTDKWQIDASTFLAAIATSEQQDIWFKALVESLHRFPNAEGERTLFRWWLQLGRTSWWDNPSAKKLLQNTSSDVFNECLVPWIQQHGPLVPEGSMAAYWLGLGQHTWDPALSRFLIFGFRDVLQTRRIPEWELYHYKRIFQAAAYQSDPVLLDVFKKGWTFQSSGFGRWQVEIEQLLQTLHFRREMRVMLKEVL